MGEGREYVSQMEEGGNIQISEDVIATIAAVSAAEVEGLGGMSANLSSDIAEFLGRKHPGKGIKVRMNDDQVVVDVAIVVKYGFPIQDVAKQVQDAVYNGLEAMAGIQASAVNIHVGGVAFEKEPKPSAEAK